MWPHCSHDDQTGKDDRPNHSGTSENQTAKDNALHRNIALNNFAHYKRQHISITRSLYRTEKPHDDDGQTDPDTRPCFCGHRTQGQPCVPSTLNVHLFSPEIFLCVCVYVQSKCLKCPNTLNIMIYLVHDQRSDIRVTTTRSFLGVLFHVLGRVVFRCATQHAAAIESKP